MTPQEQITARYEAYIREALALEAAGHPWDGVLGFGTRPADDIAGILGDVPTAQERCSMIRESRKPSCLIVDFAGNAGRHKLCCSADILGGNIDDDVVAEVSRRVRESGKPVDMAEELAKV